MRNVWQQIRLGRHPGFEEGQWLSPCRYAQHTHINHGILSMAAYRAKLGIQTYRRA